MRAVPPIFMPRVHARFSEASLAAAARDLAGIRNGLPRAIAGALNKVAAKGRTTATAELAAVMTVKPNKIRRRITRGRPATPTRLSAMIQVQGGKIAVADFKFTEQRRRRGRGTAASGTGITAQFLKGGPAVRLPHAFTAKGPPDEDGKRTRRVYEREGNGTTRVGRYPIRMPAGPSPKQVMEQNPGMQGRVKQRIGDEADKELHSQVDRLLKRPRAVVVVSSAA